MNWQSRAFVAAAFFAVSSLAQARSHEGIGAVRGPFNHRFIANCQPISPAERDTPTTAINHLDPAAAAATYVGREGTALLQAIRTSSTEVLIRPRHGTLTEGYREGSALTYIYRPSEKFLGFDATTFAIKLSSGARLLVVMPVEVGGDERFPPEDCRAKLPRIRSR